MKEDMEEKIRKQLNLRRLQKVGDWSRVSGIHNNVYGDASNISGDVSSISGNVSGIRGNIAEILKVLQGIPMVKA